MTSGSSLVGVSVTSSVAEITYDYLTVTTHEGEIMENKLTKQPTFSKEFSKNPLDLSISHFLEHFIVPHTADDN